MPGFRYIVWGLGVENAEFQVSGIGFKVPSLGYSTDGASTDGASYSWPTVATSTESWFGEGRCGTFGIQDPGSGFWGSVLGSRVELRVSKLGASYSWPTVATSTESWLVKGEVAEAVTASKVPFAVASTAPLCEGCAFQRRGTPVGSAGVERRSHVASLQVLLRHSLGGGAYMAAVLVARS